MNQIVVVGGIKIIHSMKCSNVSSFVLRVSRFYLLTKSYCK